MTSVVDKTSKNSENWGSSRHRDSKENIEESKKNGISIFNINRAPIKYGLNIVVNLYTEDIVKEEIDAIFPVPKNARLINIIKKLDILKSDMLISRFLNLLLVISKSL